MTTHTLATAALTISGAVLTTFIATATSPDQRPAAAQRGRTPWNSAPIS